MSGSRTLSNKGHGPGIGDWHNTGGLNERVMSLAVILKATVPEVEMLQSGPVEPHGLPVSGKRVVDKGTDDHGMVLPSPGSSSRILNDRP
jgi:hypothetical protein